MKTILIILLITLMSVIIFILLKNDKNQLIANYLTLGITLIGTFTGVYLAVIINDKQKLKDENDQLIELIKLTKTEIDGIIEYCKPINLNKVNATPIRMPLLFETLLSNDRYTKKCFVASSYLFYELNNLKTIQSTFEDNRILAENKMQTLNYYLYELEEINELLDNSFNSNQINFINIDKKWRKVKGSSFNNQNTSK